jgi:hypothetical protein
MLSPPSVAHLTIASHVVTVQDRVSDILNLRIALDGSSLASLVRALGKLEGVRVTERPETAGHARCHLVHVLGFQMILTGPAGEGADFASAVVSRTAQAALAVVSDLGNVFDRLMSEPAPAPATPPAEPEPALGNGIGRTSSALRRSTLQQGKPLARRTELRRKTPLARGPFKSGRR